MSRKGKKPFCVIGGECIGNVPTIEELGTYMQDKMLTNEVYANVFTKKHSDSVIIWEKVLEAGDGYIAGKLVCPRMGKWQIFFLHKSTKSDPINGFLSVGTGFSGTNKLDMVYLALTGITESITKSEVVEFEKDEIVNITWEHTVTESYGFMYIGGFGIVKE